MVLCVFILIPKTSCMHGSESVRNLCLLKQVILVSVEITSYPFMS